MKSAIDIQVLPLATTDKEELYRLVDKAIQVIDESGFDYMVGPFSTTIEGELDQIWGIALKAHKAVLEGGTDRVISYIKLASGSNLGTTEEKVKQYQTPGE